MDIRKINIFPGEKPPDPQPKAGRVYCGRGGARLTQGEGREEGAGGKGEGGLLPVSRGMDAPVLDAVE